MLDQLPEARLCVFFFIGLGCANPVEDLINHGLRRVLEIVNVRLGVSYLQELVRRFGSVSTALAAYNWGPTRIAERLRRGESIPVVYPQRVMVAYRRPFSEI